MIGRRSIPWSDVATVSKTESALVLHPDPGAFIKPVPLTTYLTSVSVDDLQNELRRFRPDLFNEIPA